MKTTIKTILITAAAALLATDLWAQQQAVLEEVVVSARKRLETLEEAPVSVLPQSAA